MSKWLLLNNPLYAPADDFGQGGGGDFDEGDSHVDDGEGDSLSGEDDDDEDDLDEDEDDDDDEGLPDNKGKGGGFDPNQLSNALINGLKPLLQQNQQPANQPTPEQIKQMLGDVSVGEDLIATLRDPETTPAKAAAALKGLMDSVVQHTLKVVGLGIEGRFQQISPVLETLQNQAREQKMEQFVQGTIRKFPALRNYGKVVRQALVSLHQSGVKPATKSEAYRLIAKAAARSIKQFGNESFSLKAKAGGPQLMRPGRGGSRGQQGGGKGFDVFSHFDGR